ncbi:hypothetical protein EMIHUDRAFT_352658 [Emiliania huxleyi CCMP1516]|uniref:Uncharacterized protein n=2 Tax=Emiliania huxleyi TaxID=2903 RepID=A0A0D3K8T1_EMIH1|nr:hypothetical protein EMIHUDRAFT_352658 [Emiliania huxleyi CCMP1516]EOD32166.1 hypothetical protein EMIHUDRAFT_352658 [Emiliania huxleyi CCMP1516]|eukprot:XP_005784595.1 hypothetical protein EMIHUDRAFT_352658 [Emiliania huxleyi CCMP1516]
MSAAAAAALILLRLALAWTASEETRVVYLMRHGEKTFNKRNKTAYLYACLSEKGWARAYNLKALFGPQPSPPFRTPSALFAGNYSNPSDCRDEHGWYRTQTTIAPLAAASPGGLDLAVESGTGWLPTLCAAEERGHCRQAAKPGSSPHDYGVCCNTAAARRVKAPAHVAARTSAAPRRHITAPSRLHVGYTSAARRHAGEGALTDESTNAGGGSPGTASSECELTC